MDVSMPLPDWIRAQELQPARIWLEEPETVREGLMGTKTHVRYTVCFLHRATQLERIKHRYSEFEAVQNALAALYSPLGFLIPSLPGKKLGMWSGESCVSVDIRGWRSADLYLSVRVCDCNDCVSACCSGQPKQRIHHCAYERPYALL
jgi:hypothetical protein